mmetsp:Transcript_72941/g.165416  ORF Transcript_72941/g.165416 Transcript_72941/m.165416 type:complete len:374 (-) Transcript_72941:85-1206(-)
MMRASVLAALAVILARAERDVDEFAESAQFASISTHEHEQLEKSEGSAGYICCLHALTADEKHIPTEISELRVSDQSSISKCLLTAFPPNCQINGQCTEECKDIVGSSVRYQMMRFSQQQKELQTSVERAGKLDSMAEAIKGKSAQEAEATHEQELKSITGVYHQTVGPVSKESADAQKEFSMQTQEVQRLTALLKVASKKLKEDKQRATELKKKLEETMVKAKEVHDNATKQADTTKENSITTAAKVYDSACKLNKNMVKGHQDMLDTVQGKVKELEQDAKKLEVREKGRAVCAKKNDEFESEDCCCSLHANGAGTPMRVLGKTFVNWELCKGAALYEKTAFIGLSCNHFGFCNKCEDFICVNSKGQKGACP